MIILNDFNTSVKKALAEIDPNYEKLNGLIICGTHSPSNIEEMIEVIKIAREEKIPILGICMGFQLLLIEYGRNILGLKGANSTEVNPKTKYPIFTKMPDLRVGMYPVAGHLESHWHNFKFNSEYLKEFEKNDYWQFVFSGDIMEIARHDNIIGTQFHPEYQSCEWCKHPLLVEFINLCRQDILIKQGFL